MSKFFSSTQEGKMPTIEEVKVAKRITRLVRYFKNHRNCSPEEALKKGLQEARAKKIIPQGGDVAYWSGLVVDSLFHESCRHVRGLVCVGARHKEKRSISILVDFKEQQLPPRDRSNAP